MRSLQTQRSKQLGTNLGGIRLSEGEELETIETTLINHGRYRPSTSNARNADSVHNPGYSEVKWPPRWYLPFAGVGLMLALAVLRLVS
jgi:hypothetical protein